MSLCPKCGERPRARPGRPCSPCIAAYQRARRPKTGPWRGLRECRYCEQEFEAKASRATVCYEQACQRQKNTDAMRASGVTNTPEWRARYRDQRASYSARRKAERRGSPLGSIVQRREIFERDGWVCQICHEPVDPEIKVGRLSASLDHVIPASKGGPHTAGNLRLAHLSCNAARGARD